MNRVLTIRTRRRAWHWRLDGWRIRPMWKCRRSCPECRSPAAASGEHE